MADQRTMAELLRAPTEGYAEAIVVPSILADQFELKHSLINMMTTNQFFGLEKDNPHDHIRWFNKITSTIKYKDVSNSAIKLMLFPFSLAGAARQWLEKEPLRFIHTWEDLDRYKDLLRACPHHGFIELHQLDTFYNALNPANQDSLNAAAGGNLLERRTQDVLTIIKNKSKGNSVYRPPGMANQIRPPGFAQPNVQNNHNQFRQPQGFNRGNNFSPEQSYQAPTQQNQNVPLNELEKVKRMNEANMKAMQTQINMVKNEMKNSIQASLSNQTNEIKNIIASLLQMSTASTSGGLVLDGPTVPTPPPFINPEEDERVEETLTNPNLVEYTIKVPPPSVQKYKPPSQREYVVHQKDPLHPNIPYPSRMLKQKQQEKDEKMLKALLSNKEKLQELANTPLNENCSAVILKKLPEKLRDPKKFLILCGFSELKCKAFANLGASINLMPLSVWKKLGLPELISTRMTLELANRAICTPAGIAGDVFVPVGRFTFPADFVIVDYKSDPRVPLILGRPFLRTAYALIDVHGEEMILHFLEDLFSNQPSGNPTFLSHPELTSPEVQDDIFDLEGGNVLPEKLLDLDSTKDLYPPLHVNPLSGSTTYSSSFQLLEEFVDELALITFPLKMFTDEHALDYSSPSIFDEYDDDFLEVESDTENIYDDPFDSNGEKIKYVDAFPSTNNEDKVFNLGIIIQEKPVKIITRVVQDKKLAISNASLVLEDFDPPLYEPLFFKEVPRSKMILPFSSENEEKNFKPGIHTSEKVHSYFIP
nr:hypothetical protein [Tanacetum cinerariifolium]